MTNLDNLRSNKIATKTIRSLTITDMTFDELTEAVENDLKSTRTKNLTEILLVAMNDWPSCGSETSIHEFVNELKDYFGTPVTIRGINSKPLQDAWKAEAGASIVEMISLSSNLDNESDFDRIIERIVQYYVINK